jgi:L-ornithine Nalpha-acyltransferase
MTAILSKGRYRARFAHDHADLRASQALRHHCFVEAGGGSPRASGLDHDDHDRLCQHVLVEEEVTGRLVCCFRLMPLRDGTQLGQTYSARYYGLDGLGGFDAPMAEIGRFCIHPKVQDADVLRIAWGALTRLVDAQAIKMLFGCTSFAGTAADRYLDAFALLRDRHLAPKQWQPQIRAAQFLRFADLPQRSPDPRRAMKQLPPLLKTYLTMGGWVGDHAVVDPEMNTLHVFTGLQISAIPAARLRALRAVAAQQ